MYTSIQCLTENELLHIHDVNEKEGLSEEDFVRICPSLIHQLQDGACIEKNRQSSPHTEQGSAKMLHGEC